MTNAIRFLVLAGLLILSSCSQDQSAKDSQLALVKTTNPDPVVTEKNHRSSHAEDIKREVSAVPEVYDVAVIEGKKGALVVYKVKHMQRFKMKKIEKDITKMLEKKYPKEKFTVSSDYKIFLEVVRLEEKMKASKISRQKAEKRFKEIVKMTEDLK